jgi:hypothetical protein
MRKLLHRSYSRLIKNQARAPLFQIGWLDLLW